MDTTEITKDTTLCISLAARPSSIGTRFHNHLYGQLGLNFVYKAFTTTDLAGAVAGIRALGIRGCGVSMPFKQDAIALVDSLDPSGQAIGSVNTIVNTDGHLRAYNTDYTAIARLLRERGGSPDSQFVVLGSGGMARAVVAALRDSGFASGCVVARNPGSGSALADEFGLAWRPVIGSEHIDLIINATPIGMAGGPEADAMPVAEHIVDAATTVVDVVATPAETPLIRRARSRGVTVITGGEVLALQAVEQFALYTGVRPTPEEFAMAKAFSLATRPEDVDDREKRHTSQASGLG